MRSYTEDYKNNSYLADMEYMPSGKVRVLTESAVHDGMSYGARTVTDYDRHGRVAAVRASAGDGAEVAAATYGYDGTGRLWKTAVPGMETVRGYNVRGNLTSIQSPVYEETLRYEDGVMTPTVTGRISERDFRLYGDLWRSYYYSYDGMGRMASAQSRDESAHSWGRLALNREFDLNGNITKILRQGAIARGVYGQTDDAALEYDGNQLRGVVENAPGVNLETSADIPPGDFGEESFGYDANGNMTSDGARPVVKVFEDNRYKFGAKELTTTYGADFYDFEARMLGTGIPAFMSIDPKAIDYQGVSPYVFCMNDPVNYVDPSGESGLAVIDIENKTITVKSHFYLYGKDANPATCDRIINSIADIWNEAQGVVEIAGVEYNVIFEIDYEIVTFAEAKQIAEANLMILTM